MTDWQPIETAPKDGSRILACAVVANRGDLGYFSYPVACRYRNESGAWLNIHDGEWFHGPTHWMPLPEPPELLLTAEEDEHTHQPMQHWCPECGPL